MKRPVVEVTWEDAANTRTWNEESQGIPGTIEARSVGFLIERSKSRIVIAAQYFDETKNWRDVMAIPAGMVRRVRRLR